MGATPTPSSSRDRYRARLPLAELVPRPRLLELLSRGCDLPLTLVVAPAGSGKTVLLGTWARDACPYPLAWFAVASEDDAGSGFWGGVLAALSECPAVTPEAPVRALAVPPTGADFGFVHALADALCALPGPLVLVLEDFHLVDDPTLLEQVDWLLAHLPAELRLMICSRRDPALSIQRFRLEGRLLEVRAADLAFDSTETRELLAGQGIELSEQDLAALHRRTEGWAAAVRLAAISLQGVADRHAFVSAFAGDDSSVAAYLTEQVLAGMSADKRDFLVRTSVVDRLTGRLADALTGGSDGQARLLELERESLLINRSPSSLGWFRYHQLLADFLRLELATRMPGDRTQLHRRAARWLAAEGLMREALDNAIAGEDWEMATDLLASHWLTLFMDGEGRTVTSALGRLPAHVIAASAVLHVAAAMGNLVYDAALEAAEEHLRRAAALAERLAPARGLDVVRSLTIVRLYAARLRGHIDPEAKAAIDSLMEPNTSGLSPDAAAAAMLSIGMVLFFGEEPQASRDVLERALDLGRQAQRDFVVLTALGGLAMLAVVQGHLEVAAQHATEAVEIAHRRGWSEQARMVPAYASLAVIAHNHLEREESLMWLERCRVASTGDVDPMHMAAVALMEARFAAVVGDWDLALRRVRRASRELDRWQDASWLGRIGTGLLLRMLIAAGDANGAREEIAKLGPAARRRLEIAVPAARLAVEDGEPERALELLAAADDAPYSGYIFTVEAALVEALAHERRADMAAAAAAVERALDLAEAEAAVQPLLGFGPAIRRLLERAVQHGTAHRALVEDVLGRLDSVAERGVQAELDEPLTERELAVLRYLPTSMSTADIAAELFVSPNTVKTHIRHIYEKLAVGRRSAAVSRARELGLIGKALTLPARKPPRNT